MKSTMALAHFEDLDELVAEESGLDIEVVDIILRMVLIVGIEEFESLVRKARRYRDDAA